MTPKHRFRPAVDGALESRLALSHAGGVAEVAAQAAGLGLTVNGRSITHLSRLPGGSEMAHLVGRARYPGLGAVQFTSDLSTNPSVLNSPTTGTTHIVLRGRRGGTLDANIAGPTTDLASTTNVALNYAVTNGTGVFRSLDGATGIADLSLQVGPVRRDIARGRFAVSL